MGRNKIAIEKIANKHTRLITMNKRRQGLTKKAYELSVLCDCEVSLVITATDGRVYEYGSTNVKEAMRSWAAKDTAATEHDTDITMAAKCNQPVPTDEDDVTPPPPPPPTAAQLPAVSKVASAFLAKTPKKRTSRAKTFAPIGITPVLGPILDVVSSLSANFGVTRGNIAKTPTLGYVAAVGDTSAGSQ